MMGMLWTDEREALLKKLWNDDGLTASQCATALGEGTTRNAVIGKVSRMRLAKRKGTTKVARRGICWSDAAKAKSQKRVAGRLAYAAKRISEQKPITRIKLPAPEAFKPEPEDLAIGAWVALPGTTPVSMAALGSETCRWPIGDETPFAFCGCPVAKGSSYCPTHKHRSTGRGTPAEQHATRSAAVISRLEVKNGFRSRQAGQSL